MRKNPKEKKHPRIRRRVFAYLAAFVAFVLALLWLMQIVWLLVVFFLPFIGVLLYLLIGRSMKRSVPDESNPGEKYDHLTKLKSLLDEGILTPEEYETEKEKILNRP